MKIKKGDNVKVSAGRDRGKTGVVERVFPTESRAVVKGINAAKKHVKPGRRNPQGGIIDINQKINLSNLSLICPNCGKMTRVGYKLVEGNKIRICRKCEQSVEGGSSENK
jgi:large subunit ribosomal protein L24